MKEELITFKTAKLAKEKGFNINTKDVFINTCKLGGSNLHIDLEPNDWNTLDFSVDNIYYSAPTQSLLQKWLREFHNIHIVVTVNSDNEGDEPVKWYWSYTMKYNNSLDDDAFNAFNDDEFNTYEEALESVLETCLSNL
jgi:hypothetical protein